MIKAIFFDFDGVLTIERTGSASITSYIAHTCGLSLDLVRRCYAPYNKSLLYDGLHHRDMWQDFCKAVGKSIDYQVLIDSFIHTALDERMIGLLRSLKQKYLIGLITDNKTDRINVILKERQLEDCFDVAAVSANLRSGKEGREIFEYAMQSLKVQPGECIFIDNTAKNLIVPERLGMKTILFDDINRDVAVFEAKLHSMLEGY